ncbi:hypothetical protein DEU56DRAFT_759080 [Suillus clintonianus]|uniref:uncharacterized protein n=1 Tax=Suillus clintonianus TaxID=1904413 RepID=UPI001B86D2C0|nr:uncharacterized protein DEU56DRAFT_759080 [Suillus clintonianus]KAG2125989.1 hypothetical protein DEU56DRAFT_759080 [Suillus clintonianus]
MAHHVGSLVLLAHGDQVHFESKKRVVGVLPVQFDRPDRGLMSVRQQYLPFNCDLWDLVAALFARCGSSREMKCETKFCEHMMFTRKLFMNQIKCVGVEGRGLGLRLGSLTGLIRRGNCWYAQETPENPGRVVTARENDWEAYKLKSQTENAIRHAANQPELRRLRPRRGIAVATKHMNVDDDLVETVNVNLEPSPSLHATTTGARVKTTPRSATYELNLIDPKLHTRTCLLQSQNIRAACPERGTSRLGFGLLSMNSAASEPSQNIYTLERNIVSCVCFTIAFDGNLDCFKIYELGAAKVLGTITFRKQGST